MCRVFFPGTQPQGYRIGFALAIHAIGNGLSLLPDGSSANMR